MFARLRAAWSALLGRTPHHTPTPHTTPTTNTLGNVTDSTALLGRDFSGPITTGPTHHGDVHHGPTTNNTAHGPVGVQTGNVTGGMFNVGGTINGSAIGNGATVNHVAHNDGGQVVQAHTIHGVTFQP